MSYLNAHRGFLTKVALCFALIVVPIGASAQSDETAVPESAEEQSAQTQNAQPVAPLIKFSTGVSADLPLTPSGTVSSFVTLNQDRLFFESAFGKRSMEDLQVRARSLQQENSVLTGDLEAEETRLAQNRSNMDPEEFRREADAFDEKVVAIRAAQDQKLQDLNEMENQARSAFGQAIVPVLQQILQSRNAVGILDSRVVILPSPKIDITDEAISLVDQILGDGAE